MMTEDKMTPDLDALLQQGFRVGWNAVIEQLRNRGGIGEVDPAVEAVEHVRAEVRDLVQSLSDASSVRDVNKAGALLNERIEMMKGLESAMSAERPLATAGTV